MNNFIIKDSFENLSKSKKTKIKQWCKKNLLSLNDFDEFKKQHVLSMVNSNIENKNELYNHVSLSYNNETDINTLLVDKQISQRDLLKKKILEKQKERGKKINSSIDKRWELYKKIKDMPQMKNIPENVIDVALPNPDQIKENEELYKKNLSQIPNSILKEYFTLCLNY